MLVKWRPRFGLAARPDEFDRIMGRFFGDAFRSWDASGGEDRAWSPSVDIVEENGSYDIRAELPGLKREDVEVFVDDGELVLRGERKWENEEKERSYHRLERRYGKFERRFVVPEGVRPEDLKAQYKDGILSVKVPKVEAQEPKKIPIQID